MALGSYDLQLDETFFPSQFPYLCNERFGWISKGPFTNGSVQLTISASLIFDHNTNVSQVKKGNISFRNTALHPSCICESHCYKNQPWFLLHPRNLLEQYVEASSRIVNVSRYRLVAVLLLIPGRVQTQLNSLGSAISLGGLEMNMYM